MNRNRILIIVTGILLIILVGFAARTGGLRNFLAPTAPAPTPESQNEWQQYGHEDGFSFLYPADWILTIGQPPTPPVVNRVDVVEQTEENNFTASSIAVIMTEESPQSIEDKIITEFDGQLEEEREFGNLTGKLFIATTQETSHNPEMPESQLEFVATANNQTFWFRLFSSPDSLDSDREIYYRLLESFRYEN